jgi:predicted DNA-binding transcriptional regulator YafY
VSNTIANSQGLKDRILLEDVPSGQKYLQTIIRAMKENKVINITYHSFWKDEEHTFDVQPLCVKLFRQRWYMVGQSTAPEYQDQPPRIYALDRIHELHTTGEHFKMPKGWTANDYFDGCFGIIVDQRVEMQKVKLKVAAGQANYIRSLMLHPSQREIEQNEEYSVFEYRLRPTFDFIQEILRNGEDMEVLEPLSLRDEISGIIERLGKKYDI